MHIVMPGKSKYIAEFRISRNGGKALLDWGLLSVPSHLYS